MTTPEQSSNLGEDGEKALHPRFPCHHQACAPRYHYGLLGLPSEILNIIADDMDQLTLMLFSLTCRTFYGDYFPKSTDLNSSEMIEFLLFLEQDTPGYYFCYVCVKLHSWSLCRGRWKVGDTSGSFIWGPDPCRIKYTFNRGLHFISYHYARLVMNAHIFGAAHGFPVQTLDDHLTWDLNKFGVKECSNLAARILDDQLILSIEYTLFQKDGDAKKLREYIDRSGPHVCEHLTTRRGYPWNGLLELDVNKSSSPPKQFITCAGSVKSCSRCMTDYCADIHWHSSRKGWIIKITAYHQLGAVRSPNDWHWRTQTEWVSRQPHRSSLQYPPGFVRHTWSKADEVILAPEGEWAREDIEAEGS